MGSCTLQAGWLVDWLVGELDKPKVGKDKPYLCTEGNVCFSCYAPDKHIPYYFLECHHLVLPVYVPLFYLLLFWNIARDNAHKSSSSPVYICLKFRKMLCQVIFYF